MRIRPYAPTDWDAVWAILDPVFRAGETYAFPQDMDSERGRAMWTTLPKVVFVAEDEDTGRLLGTYYVRPNFDGPGSHVCNCGYVVAADAQGRGVAAAMCEHSQREAVTRGFRAMQFNAVVSTNERAVRLWLRLGFVVVGTVPGAFHHPRFGFVDTHVMHKWLLADHGQRAWT